MNTKNMNGPIIEPWGTPFITISSSERILLILTLCLRLSK